MSTTKQAPSFIFYANLPARLTSTPALVSSIQTFESSLLLIAAGRYPHALASCAFAIESAAKAYRGIKPDEFVKFWDVLNPVRDERPKLRRFSGRSIDELYKTRNRFVHYGFSPDDDSVAARQLLEIGFPFLAECYRDLFQFDWTQSLTPVDDRLSEQLKVSVRVYAKAPAQFLGSEQACLSVVAHVLRRLTRHVSEADFAVEERMAASDARWEAIRKCTAELSRKLSPDWTFQSCPVCEDIDCLVCELDSSRLEAGEISIVVGYCCGCGLLLPRGCNALNDEVCKTMIDEERSRILTDYAIPSTT